jgi:hypothetical protein
MAKNAGAAQFLLEGLLEDLLDNCPSDRRVPYWPYCMVPGITETIKRLETCPSTCPPGQIRIPISPCCMVTIPFLVFGGLFLAAAGAGYYVWNGQTGRLGRMQDKK